MQRKIIQTGTYLGNEAAKLPCEDTPNYKVAAAATAFLALDTLISSLNCGSFSFYLNAAATLFSAGIAYNQYNNGAPLNKAKSIYAGLFGKKEVVQNPEMTAPEASLPALSM